MKPKTIRIFLLLFLTASIHSCNIKKTSVKSVLGPCVINSSKYYYCTYETLVYKNDSIINEQTIIDNARSNLYKLIFLDCELFRKKYFEYLAPDGSSIFTIERPVYTDFLSYQIKVVVHNAPIYKKHIRIINEEENEFCVSFKINKKLIRNVLYQKLSEDFTFNKHNNKRVFNIMFNKYVINGRKDKNKDVPRAWDKKN